MASLAFTPGTPAITNVFHGVGMVGVKLYASGTMTDIDANLDQEAEVEINLVGEKVEQKIHRASGPITRWWSDAMVELLFRFGARTAELLSYAFGKDPSAVTDNSTNSPKDKTVAYGDKHDLIYLAMQVQTPISEAASPLYHIIHIPKCTAIPGSAQFRFGRKSAGSMPVKFESVADLAHATYPGCHIFGRLEYV